MQILTFEKIQERHDALSQELADEGKIDTSIVHAFIGSALRSSKAIDYIHDRQKLRNILLYWAGYLTSLNEEWPDINIDLPSRKPKRILSKPESGCVKKTIFARMKPGQKHGVLISIDEAYVLGCTYKKFTKMLVDELRMSCDNSSLRTPQPERIRWDLLATYFDKNSIDFCSDPYFLTESRAYKIGVIQYGWLHAFRCVLTKNSKLLATEFCDTSLKTSDRLSAAFQNIADCEIGVLGDTAATSEVLQSFYLDADRTGRVFSGCSATLVFVE